ncbi:MAG TPA: SpoIIE family protein phosphatase [Pyrinomonadaceae bacterium]|nr:SpoIIE family protein phosphatase [Pyrinomonadaceae bacterium]
MMESVRMERTPAAAVMDSLLHGELVDRLQRLQVATSQNRGNPEFAHLLDEVDAALKRFENRTFGLCETCHDPIEPERLLADPLIRVCLGDLTDRQRNTLENDLELAATIQNGLLPRTDFISDFAHVDFAYLPASIVSGDYVDVIPHDGEIYFILGDVSGKGMAASLLMSNLHAMFHSMVPLGLPLSELMERANRLFSESTLANQYATLICGKINRNGEVEIANAGHLPPILVTTGEKVAMESAGLPLGLFCESNFAAMGFKLQPNETLLLYTDGVTEANDFDGGEFGVDRLIGSINGSAFGAPSDLIKNCLMAIDGFRGAAVRNDDLTLLALKYTGEVN